MDHTDVYDQLTHLFVEIILSQQGTKLDDDSRCLYWAEPLAIKLFRHLVSMRQIADGLNIESSSYAFTQVDHGSVNLLARAAIETYLAFFFIFVAPVNNGMKRFRFKAWELGGLLDRQKFHAVSVGNKEIQVQEAISISNLRDEIAKLDEFLRLTKKEQRLTLNGEWRLGLSWTDLAVKADFNERYFRNIYSYLCGYAHSGFLSAMQISQAKPIEVQRQLANSTLGVGVVLMSHFIFSYASLFKAAAAVLENNLEAKRLAEIWRFGADDMADFYRS